MKDERHSYKTQFEFLEFLFSGREVLKILTSRFNICSIIKRFLAGIYVTFLALNRREWLDKNSHRTEFEHHARLMKKKNKKKKYLMFNRFSFSADILHSTLCPLCHFMSTTDKSEKKRMKKKIILKKGGSKEI